MHGGPLVVNYGANEIVGRDRGCPVHHKNIMTRNPIVLLTFMVFVGIIHEFSLGYRNWDLDYGPVHIRALVHITNVKILTLK